MVGKKALTNHISCHLSHVAHPGMKREQVFSVPFAFTSLCVPPPLHFGDKALFFLLFALLCHFHFLFFVFTDILPASLFSESQVDVCQERIEGHSLFQRDPESKNEGAN